MSLESPQVMRQSKRPSLLSASPRPLGRVPNTLLWWSMAATLWLGAGCGDEGDASPEGQAQTSTPDGGMGGEMDAVVEEDASPPEVPPCGDGVCEADEVCEADCDPAPVSLQDPLAGLLRAYPDDFFTRADEASLTGLRVDIDVDRLPEVLTFPEAYRGVFEELNTLDGFSTSGGGFFQFSRALAQETLTSGADSALVGSTVLFGVLSREGAFEPTPVELKFTDEGRTVVIRPMVPLPPKQRAVAAITTGVTGEDGLAVKPGAYTRALLEGAAPAGSEALRDRYGDAVAALVEGGFIDDADDLGALTVFTTQSIEETSVAVAADIRSREHSVAERFGCDAPRNGARRCLLSFDVGQYRDDEGIVQTTAQGQYRMLVTAYLPVDTSRYGSPAPTLIFGHGLTGDRNQGQRLARHLAPRGVVTLAIDAPEHGQHPTRQGVGELASLASFFGFATDRFALEGLSLRDNWRQATYDKLALVALLKSGLDIDGDGQVDVDPARIGYVGASLGGIMGPELLALSPDMLGSVLIVAGARVTDIMQFGELFEDLLRLLTPVNTPAGDVDRFWPVLQTVVERGDGVNYAPRVLRDRLDDAEAPDLLVGMVIDDEVVPEITSFALARALGAPQIAPALRPVGLVPIEMDLPVSANIDAATTAGLMQFPDVLNGDGFGTATHANIAEDELGLEVWSHFLESVLDLGYGEIIDPYDALGVERP